MKSVGIAIPTLNASKELPLLLPRLQAEAGVTRILVVDSASTDDTAAVVSGFPGVQFRSIARGEFNHGGTRELARKLLGTDIVVFVTQDVIPVPGFVSALVAPIQDGIAAVSYARQLPHVGAGFFEAFPREFNYPAERQVRSLGDVQRHGVYTFFCSDSAAAYSNAALDRIGGFADTLTNEDYFAVARLLAAGERIAYAAESQVHHSHRYTLSEEFRRYFDTGYVRAENPWVQRLVGHAEARGSSFLLAMMKRLLRTAPWLIPYALLQTFVKWLGYRAGFHSLGWPLRWCERLSSQRYYWRSVHCRHGRPAGAAVPRRG